MADVVRFTFNPFQENTYVLRHGREAIVVDPGCWNTAEEQELERYLTEQKLTVVRCVLTHAHIDHVLGTAWLADRFGQAPWLHVADREWLDMAPRQGALYGILCDPPPDPAGWLTEGDHIPWSGPELRVIEVPGHAPGHIALVCEAQRFVIAGDVLFQGSIGRTDLPGGDLDTLLKSIKERLLPLGDDFTVHCGHGPSTTIGRERRSNPFLR